MVATIMVGFLGVAFLPASYAQKIGRPILAAASSLSFVLPKISSAFSRTSGKQVSLSFGSSGNISRQIILGAPYQLFFSADEKYIEVLIERSLTVNRGSVYAEGSLVLYTGPTSSVVADPGLVDLKKSIQDNRLHRFAIANPVHAPYGRAAREALIYVGLWQVLKGKSVVGENVAQAARFTTTGTVQAGLISYSLALAIPVSKRGSFALIPKNWYSPIKQKMVLIRGAGEVSKAFYNFMFEKEAQSILTKFGFSLTEKP